MATPPSARELTPVTALRPMGTLPVSASVDDGDSPRDVMDLLALDAFVAGREPFSRSAYLEDVLAEAELLPAGARVLRESVDDDCTSRLAVGDGWTLRATHWRRARRAAVSVTATSSDLADSMLLEATEGAVETPPPSADRVPIGFWHRSTHGPLRTSRQIETPRWSAIRGNYTARVTAAVDRLMAVRPADVAGRLLLLHGPPGTGKTTLLRALAEQWREWCQVDCVLDPERLFADPGYLVEVALGPDGDGHGHGHGDGHSDAGRWRMLLLEDCDELVRLEAKASTGQALSRLLNLTDGLLGQGRHVIVAITTNENLASLHPAVTRPGRSLAHLEVGRLTPDEARGWLADHAPAGGFNRAGGVDRIGGFDPAGVTLAELYGLRSAVRTVSVVDEGPVIGGYL